MACSDYAPSEVNTFWVTVSPLSRFQNCPIAPRRFDISPARPPGNFAERYARAASMDGLELAVYMIERTRAPFGWESITRLYDASTGNIVR